MNRWLVLLLPLLAGCTAVPEPWDSGIGAGPIAAHVRFLSSDLLEGRGVGGRGEALTVEYLAAQLAVAGASPAGDGGGYFQRVPLVSLRTQPSSVLRLAGHTLEMGGEFVGSNERQTGREVLDAELVYVGHGIVAPEFGWDDYKDIDVAGKVVVLFTNEPPSEAPDFFGGRALTYYGRWTFKYEEAARRGAVGALIVHTDETAGYPWEVVRNSWSGEQHYVAVEEGEAQLALAGWLHSSAAERLFAAVPRDERQDARRIAGDGEPRGLSPAAAQRAGAGRHPHSDRAGRGPERAGAVRGRRPGPQGRGGAVHGPTGTIWACRRAPAGPTHSTTGAVDNATGCAVLLEIARAFGRLPERPPRSVLFAFVGAEGERPARFGVLRGEPGDTRWAHCGQPQLRRFCFRWALRAISRCQGTSARRCGLPLTGSPGEFDIELMPDPHPEQGYFYRSDHFSLAKRGVPAFSLKTGSEVIGRPSGWGEERVREYRTQHYHQPTDEYRTDWDFAGIERLARFGFELGRAVATQQGLPTWVEGDEFLAAREQSWQ